MEDTSRVWIYGHDTAVSRTEFKLSGTQPFSLPVIGDMQMGFSLQAYPGGLGDWGRLQEGFTISRTSSNHKVNSSPMSCSGSPATAWRRACSGRGSFRSRERALYSRLFFLAPRTAVGRAVERAQPERASVAVRRRVALN